MRDFTVITNLQDGRSLISTVRGDQYWIEDQDGSKTSVPAEEAVKLLEEAKKRGQIKPARRKRAAQTDPEDLDAMVQETLEHAKEQTKKLNGRSSKADSNSSADSLSATLLKKAAKDLFGGIQKKKKDP